MAVEGGNFLDISCTASADLSSNQFYIVSTSGNDTCNLCTTTTGSISGPKGVLQNDPASGAAAQVRVLGKSRVVASSSAIAIGAHITSSTGGGAITALDSDDWCIGIANTASAAIGDVIEIHMYGAHFYSTGA